MGDSSVRESGVIPKVVSSNLTHPLMFEDFIKPWRYEENKIGRTTVRDGIVISTVHRPEGGYETAILDDPKRKVLTDIVEYYDTEEKAKEGHEKWIKVYKQI